MFIDVYGFNGYRATELIAAPFCYKVIPLFRIKHSKLHDLVTERCNRARDDLCITPMDKLARSSTIGQIHPLLSCTGRHKRSQLCTPIKKPTLASGLQRNVYVTTTVPPLTGGRHHAIKLYQILT